MRSCQCPIVLKKAEWLDNVADLLSKDSDVVVALAWRTEVEGHTILRCLLDHVTLQRKSLKGQHNRSIILYYFCFKALMDKPIIVRATDRQ